MNRLTQAYSSFAIMLFNAIIVFIFLNIFAAQLDKPATQKKERLWFNTSELLSQFPDKAELIYPGLSSDQISQRLKSVRRVPHPILEFMTKPLSSPAINVGPEGIRSNKGAINKNVEQMLNGSIWLLGGSTGFGLRVADHETITAHLAELNPQEKYINLGVIGYHQNNEIQKLVYLLRKGYRPKAVIFLDGLNDIVRIPRDQFSDIDIPSEFQSAFSYLFSTMQAAKQSSSESNLAMALPLIRFIKNKKKAVELQKAKISNEFYTDFRFDQESSEYITQPLVYFRKISHLGAIGTTDMKFQQRDCCLDQTGIKLESYYEKNRIFLTDLAKAFNFRFFVFLQPLGPLSSNNPFLKNISTFRETSMYKVMHSLSKTAQTYFKNLKIDNYVDLSTADDSCSHCYVDLTHYNSELNKILAKKILNHL